MPGGPPPAPKGAVEDMLIMQSMLGEGGEDRRDPGPVSWHFPPFRQGEGGPHGSLRSAAMATAGVAATVSSLSTAKAIAAAR